MFPLFIKQFTERITISKSERINSALLVVSFFTVYYSEREQSSGFLIIIPRQLSVAGFHNRWHQ